ncbi:MAG: hypothetical protein IJM30_09735 [Thermoguttaceae bacterium]|nr:hypothetical protein [Thermoguttaceae bacterium]
MKKIKSRSRRFYVVLTIVLLVLFLNPFSVMFSCALINAALHSAYSRFVGKCHSALQAGDSEEALRLAKIGYGRFKRTREPSRPFVCDYALHLPRALELAGDFDSAIKYYELLEERYRGRTTTTFRARIAYKKGEREEAFRDYCSYFQDYPSSNRGVVYSDAKQKDQYLRQRVIVRRLITGEEYPDVKRLSPFTEFSDFASFMEEEFEKLGRPKEFEEPMFEIREIDAIQDKFDEQERADWERWGGGSKNPTILEEREILRKERDQAKAPSA